MSLVLDLAYQYRCIASLQCSLRKPKQTTEFTLSRSDLGVVFGLSLDLHVLSYFVDYSRTGSTGSSESLRLANAINGNLAQFSSGSNTRMEQNG